MYLRARVAEEIARGLRFPTNFALMLAEAEAELENTDDQFASIVAIGQVLRQSTRLIDLTCYMANGQFALLLPHTGREAKVLAQRLCQQIANLQVPPGSGVTPLHPPYRLLGIPHGWLQCRGAFQAR